MSLPGRVDRSACARQAAACRRQQTGFCKAAASRCWHSASRRIKASREELHDALRGELTASHVFVLDELLRHIEELEARIARFDARLLDELASEHNALALLQTLPGVDTVGAAMLLVEIGSDLSVFGSANRLASWVGICPAPSVGSCR